MTSTSGTWDMAYSDFVSVSANRDAVITKVENTSADWDQMYTDMTGTSGQWDMAYSDFVSVSANRDAVISKVEAASGTWDASVNNIDNESLPHGQAKLNSLEVTSSGSLSALGENYVGGTVWVLSGDQVIQGVNDEINIGGRILHYVNGILVRVEVATES
jgi:hypothetical protein